MQVVSLMKYLKAKLLLHTFNLVATPAELPRLFSELPPLHWSVIEKWLLICEQECDSHLKSSPLSG